MSYFRSIEAGLAEPSLPIDRERLGNASWPEILSPKAEYVGTCLPASPWAHRAERFRVDLGRPLQPAFVEKTTRNVVAIRSVSAWVITALSKRHGRAVGQACEWPQPVSKRCAIESAGCCSSDIKCTSLCAANG